MIESRPVLHRMARPAALVAAFVQGVVDPHMGGPGGYMLLTQFRPALGQAEFMDDPALARSLTRADMWEDRYLRPSPMGRGYFLQSHVNVAGYTSICTPGSIKGFQRMQEQWEVSALGRILPARHRHGGGRTQDHASRRQRLAAPAGAPRGAGPAGPYKAQFGSVASVSAGGRRNLPGGRVVSQSRLRRFPTSSGRPRRGRLLPGRNGGAHGPFGNFEIASAPTPHGGPTVVAILKNMETFRDEPGLAPNSPHFLYLLGMAMKSAFADRNPHMGDPPCGDVPLDGLMSKERAAYWHDVKHQGDPIHVSFSFPGLPDTTHVTSVDRWGICVAPTHSLGSSSGVITTGLGFVYNNSMINFHLPPGHRNSIAPRKGRTTEVAPTVVTRGGRCWSWARRARPAS